MEKIFNYTNFLNESEILVDLDKGETGLSHLKRYGKIDLTKANRLTHLLYDFDENGSPLVGEKIAELLLNATNLNYFNKSYPFVDMKIKEPIDGTDINDEKVVITKDGEYISVKTSSTKYSLSTCVTDVNGFKIGQLLQFVIKLLPLNIFKNQVFKVRNSLRTDSIVTVYYRFMKKIQNVDPQLYVHLYESQLYYIFLLKKHIDDLRTPAIINVTNINDFYLKMFSIILNSCNKIFNKNYDQDFKTALLGIKPKLVLTDDIINEFKSTGYQNINFNNFLPKEISDMRVSYCMIYFDPDMVVTGRGKKKEENLTDTVIMHLQKTRSVRVADLLDRSNKLWIGKGYHLRQTRTASKENLYFKFEDIVEIFEPNKVNIPKNEVEFDTHLKVIISKEGIKNFSKRPEKQTDMIVNIIDEIKGLPSDEITTRVLSDMAKITNLMKTKNDKKKLRFVEKFSDFMRSLGQKNTEL